jgi:uncharacterized membrane protein
MAATDDTAAPARFSRRTPHPLRSGQGIKVEQTITINRPVSEVYAFWNEVENLPKFMKHLQSVRMNDSKTSHWILQPSHNSTLEWDAEIIENRPDELISWESLPGSDVANAGSVWFKPAAAGQGTVVKITLKYDPPGGKFAAKVAQWLGEDATTVIENDLQRFKILLETGEIPSAEEQPRGGQ